MSLPTDKGRANQTGAFQLKSIADPNGLDGNASLVATIYFPIDSATLDQRDRLALEKLMEHYARLLHRKRAEFICIGYADRRGSTKYNEALGKKRAETVQRYLDGALRTYGNYTSWQSVSHGERFAVQRGATSARMAVDRRVDVFCTLVNRVPTNVPKTETPIPSVPMVQRMLGRSFSKVESEHWRGEDDHIAEGVRGMIDIVFGQIDPEYSLGDENRAARKIGQVRADYHVNRVVIETHLSYEVVASGGSVTITDTFFTYEWGTPAALVTVETRYIATLMGTRHPPKVHQETLPRTEADATPLIFPPDPK